MAACKDCNAEGIVTNRPANYPGPRCTTHHRAVTKARKATAHGNRVSKGYGINGEQYAEIKAEQGGVCFICRRATGASRNLAVDHDHNVGCGHDPKQGCPQCVRGLLCSTCNKMLAHARDDLTFFVRAINYLANPPARKVLG